MAAGAGVAVELAVVCVAPEEDEEGVGAEVVDFAVVVADVEEVDVEVA